MNIKFSINGQKISILERPTTISYTNELEAEFSFSNEWAGRQKTAIFKRTGIHAIPVLIENDKCIVPKEVLRNCSKFEVGVIAGNIHTTNIVEVYIDRTCYNEDAEIPDPTPIIYDQIIEKLESIIKGGEGGEGGIGPQGPAGPQGPQGPQGDDGKSAYQIAVDNGYVGTEHEWLATLKGDKGDTGAQGPKGEAGPQGPQGPQGPKGDAATAEIVREEIDKAIANGTISNYDDTSVKASINSIQDILNGTSSDGEETSIKGTEFSSFQGIKSGSSLTLTASSSFTAFSHGKNYLPFSIGRYDNNLTTVSEDSESITLQIKGGNTFKHFRLSPIFLKAGTYTVSLTTTKVSGDDIANAGFIYVFVGDTQETQGTQLKAGKSPLTITLDADNWLMLDVYMNTNCSFTNDTVYKFSNFQIEKASAFTSYEKYSGTSKTGTSVSFAYTSGIEIYTTTEVTLKYTKTGSQTSMSYAQVLEAVASIGTSSNSKTVVAYGDSLTCGTGNDVAKPSSETNSDNSYPAVLGRKLGSGYTVINAGVGGEPSWMIAARQGGMPVEVLPATIPATKTSVRVYLKGMEQDAYYNKDTSKWTYSEDALSYNIAVDGNANINPVKINGIEGTLTRVLLSSGSADPTTGETVQSNTYAYYFTRSTAGEASTFTTPKTLITYASENYKDAISIIWAGQNDAPLINGKYFVQDGTAKRIRRMIEHTNSKKYIVMQTPSSSDVNDIPNDQIFRQEFGEHYINIRKFICDYGIQIASELGLTVNASDSNCYKGSTEVDSNYATVGASIDAGVIPRVFRKDGVHGNYYYYQMVAKAVYEKGKDLGYWN